MSRQSRTIFGLLVAVIAAAVFAAAQASASSAPVVIAYAKTCDLTIGHCIGTAGNGGTIEMQVTGFRPTGTDAQLTLTEWITVGNTSFSADMTGHWSPAGFIVLNGSVTEGSFAGAHVHQRSDYVGGDPTASRWVGELRLAPAST
jgi:hypothetical protein